MTEVKRPKVNSAGQTELDKLEKQFETYDENIKQMTQDRLNTAPKLETDQQTKMSQKDLERSKEIYLKPIRSIGSREKFNEDYRSDYEHAKEYVKFIAENKEIIGEAIDMWVKPFAGMPAEEWKIPVNKPVWAPRYVAERIAGCKYHRFEMQGSSITGSDGMGQYYGSMVVDNTVNRLDAHPVSEKKTVFMGSGKF